jgi:hypothetical protein
LFTTSVFLSLTIGVPFCVFKFLFGILAIDNGYTLTGTLILLWSVIDLAMNFTRILLELGGTSHPSLEFCSLAQAGRLFGRSRLMLTFDTFLSFFIICFVLWSGWITQLPGWGMYLWYAATTVNLMSLAIMNLWIEAFSGSAGSAGKDSK